MVAQNDLPLMGGKDVNPILNGISIIEHGAQNLLSGTMATIGAVPFDGKKLLDTLISLDACNLSGVIRAALNAMHAIQNLMQAITSLASGFNIGDILGSLLSGVENALKEFESILTSSLYNALLNTFCSNPCGPIGSASGGLGNLAGLAALAGQSLTNLLNGILDPFKAISSLANAAAAELSGGVIPQLSSICLSKLIDEILGNLNICGLLKMLIDELFKELNLPTTIGKRGIGSFDFMSKILDMIEALFAGIADALGLLNAFSALSRALSCSGYVLQSPALTNPLSVVSPPQLYPTLPPILPPGGNGGPGGLGGNVGGQGGIQLTDVSVNAVFINTASSNIHILSITDRPLNIPRNNQLNLMNPNISNQQKIQVSSLEISNSEIVTSIQVGNTNFSTNIPRKTR